jgi:hypothetical protein
MFRTTLVAMLALALCCSTAASAALRFERNTTLTDASGGTMTTRSTGSFAAESGNALSEAAFLNFAPREGRGQVNGSISLSRDRNREARSITLSYDGNLTLNLPADISGQAARTVTVVFNDLVVTWSRGERRGERRVDGRLVINGHDVAAQDAPRSIIAVLIGLARLMRA